MSSKVHFDGGLIAFFDCTKSDGKVSLDFRISTRFQAHSFQNDFIFEIIFSSLSKGVFSLSSHTFVLNFFQN